MGSVAVVASCRFFRAEMRHLAVERFEVGLRDFLMTSAALVQDILSETAPLDTLDGMGLVAILASREQFVCICDRRTMYAGLEFLVNAKVAVRTRRWCRAVWRCC